MGDREGDRGLGTEHFNPSTRVLPLFFFFFLSQKADPAFLILMFFIFAQRSKDKRQRSPKLHRLHLVQLFIIFISSSNFSADLQIQIVCIWQGSEDGNYNSRTTTMATLVFSHFPSLQLPKHFSVLACPNATRIGFGSTQHHLFSWKSLTYLLSISVVLSGTEDIRVSSTQSEVLSITVITTCTNGGELKISVEVSGAKTQTIFDVVFDKMVSAAQPIPGFRRVKGGKTPNIPRDFLVEVLGPSEVYKQVIKKVINSTIDKYVEKEGLEVKDLRVTCSRDKKMI